MKSFRCIVLKRIQRAPADHVQPSVSQRAAYQRADADLNRLYQLMTARLSTDDVARKRLVDAQRKWLQFRDAERAFQTIRTVGGSIQPMNVSSCLTDLTRERVTDLQKHLDCARVMGEGGACAVPPRR